MCAVCGAVKQFHVLPTECAFVLLMICNEERQFPNTPLTGRSSVYCEVGNENVADFQTWKHSSFGEKGLLLIIIIAIINNYIYVTDAVICQKE